MKTQTDLGVLVAILSFGALVALPLVIAASVQHGHRVELENMHDELHAECIAVILGHRPRETWLDVAIEFRDDPYVCKYAMEHYPDDLPMRGEDWQRRLDISRSVINP